MKNVYGNGLYQYMSNCSRCLVQSWYIVAKYL